MFHSSITKFAAVAFGAALLAQGASAQNQAHTPVKIIIGFPAGGALDNLARAMAEKLRTELGRTVIVDNKPGASFNHSTPSRALSTVPCTSALSIRWVPTSCS